MVLKKIDINNMFNFIIIIQNSNYDKYKIMYSKHIKEWIILNNNYNKKIESIYTDMNINKRIFIKFKGEKTLKQYRIIGLDI